MGRSMLVMMLIGLAILATMISGVVLATTRGRYDREGQPTDPRLGGQGLGPAPGNRHGHGAMPPEGSGR